MGGQWLLINVNDIHRAAFLALFQILQILIEAHGDLEAALLGGVEKLGQTLIVHLEVMRRGIGAETATDALGFFMTDADHGVTGDGMTGCQASTTL